MLQPWRKRLPAFRLFNGVGPAKNSRRQRTATPILATTATPAHLARTGKPVPGPDHSHRPCHQRGSRPPPVTPGQP